MTPRFPVTYMDMEVLREHLIGPLRVKTYPAVHTRETNPTSLRVEVADKIIAYTGDSRIVDPLGELLATAAHTESILLADVSAATVRSTREHFPFLQDRR